MRAVVPPAGSYSYDGTDYAKLLAATHTGRGVVVIHEWTNNAAQWFDYGRSQTA